MDNSNLPPKSTDPRGCHTPQAVPFLNSAGQAKPQQPGEQDIQDIVANAPRLATPICDPATTSQALERSPSRSKAEKRREKDARKAAKRANRSRSSDKAMTTGWQSTLRRAKNDASHLRKRISLSNLAGVDFRLKSKHPKEDMLIDLKEENPKESLADQNVKEENSAKEGSWSRVLKCVKKAFSPDQTSRS